jgi:hypothetical protein
MNHKTLIIFCVHFPLVFFAKLIIECFCFIRIDIKAMPKKLKNYNEPCTKAKYKKVALIIGFQRYYFCKRQFFLITFAFLETSLFLTKSYLL